MSQFFHDEIQPREATLGDKAVKALIRLGITLGVLFVLFLIFIIFFRPWGYVENYQLGYKFDKRTGQITVIPHAGYVSRTPIFESINTIDLRPRQVCITAGAPAIAGQSSSTGANARVLNCKLVQFTPGPNNEGLAMFLAWHGRDDYEGENLDDLLKIYAYDGSGRTYPFLKVLRELKSDDAPLPIAPVAIAPAAPAPAAKQ